MTEPHRAVRWLHRYGRRYPRAWQLYAQLMADPPAEWPRWCWMPLAGTYAVLSGGGDNRCTVEQAADVGILGGLAAWRATQGIYRVHPTLLAELLDTPITGDLPADVLTRLPEWCVYVETPGCDLWGMPLHGYWAYLEHDAEDGRDELRLVLDTEWLDGTPQLGQMVMHLGGTLEDGVRAAVSEVRVQALRAGRGDQAPSLGGLSGEALTGPLSGLVSVLLYLCADEAEIEERRDPPPKVVRGKKRPIAPAAKAPVVHPCGYRIGARLELAQRRARSEGAEVAGATVAPHIRRAHWHRYWTGPRDGERRVVLRWLSPILVGLDDVPDEATVRKVDL